VNRNVPLKRGEARLSRTTGLKQGGELKRAKPFRSRPRQPAETPVRPRPSHPETGFLQAVKLKIRTRAGNGDIDQAACENCGRWLGRYGGEIQHRLARGSGGSRSRVVNGVSNGALLCGNRYEGCHKKAEDRDDDMRIRGWWIRSGKGPDHDPRFIPVVSRTADGDLSPRWFTADGGVTETDPRGAA